MHFPVRRARVNRLYDLNADCLAYIFEKLDIHDLYAVACAYPPLDVAFSLFNRKFEYTVTNINATNSAHFFECVGMQIKTLNVTIGEHIKASSDIIRFFECIQKHCPNIKHLLIRKWSDLNLSRFGKLLNGLESLQLEECDYNEKSELANRRFMINPWIVIHPAFYSMQSTQSKSTGLAELVNVSTLKLHKCRGLHGHHLLDFFRRNQNLTELTLFGLKDLLTNDTSNANFFAQISQHLQSLETISIDVNTTTDIQFVADLPKLRSLQLLDYSVYDDRVVDRLLRKLCESQRIEELDLYHCNLGQQTYRTISQYRRLHTLKLRKNFWVTDQHLQSLSTMQSLRTVCCFDNIILTDEGVLSIVRMSPLLTQLDVSWCFQVTNRTVHDILRVLYEEPHRPKLEILAGGRTKITESIVNVSITGPPTIFSIFSHLLTRFFSSLVSCRYRICQPMTRNVVH